MKPKKCLRCNVDFQELGIRRFHEGPRAGFWGDVAELLVNQESFLVCRCNSCGEVAFFIPGFEDNKDFFEKAQRRNETLNEIKEKYGNIKKHEQYKDFLKGDPARKFFSQEDQMIAFYNWLKQQELQE